MAGRTKRKASSSGSERKAKVPRYRSLSPTVAPYRSPSPSSAAQPSPPAAIASYQPRKSSAAPQKPPRPTLPRPATPPRPPAPAPAPPPFGAQPPPDAIRSAAGDPRLEAEGTDSLGGGGDASAAEEDRTVSQADMLGT
ncbi:hypothetical protein JCM6882_007580, partial [Rhodosporidiobolus microsporus]